MYGFIASGSANLQLDSKMPTYFKGEEGISVLSGKTLYTDPEPSLSITPLVTNYKNPIFAYRPTSTDFTCPVRIDYDVTDKTRLTSIKFCREERIPYDFFNPILGESVSLHYRLYLSVISAKVEGSGIFVKNSEGEPIFQNCDSNFVGIPYEIVLPPLPLSVFNYQDVIVRNADKNYFILAPVSYCITDGVGDGHNRMCFAGLKYIDSTTIRVAQFSGMRVLSAVDSSPWNKNFTLIEVGPDLYD